MITITKLILTQENIPPRNGGIEGKRDKEVGRISLIGFKPKSLFPDIDIVPYGNGLLVLNKRCGVRHHGPTRVTPWNPRRVHVQRMLMLMLLMRMLMLLMLLMMMLMRHGRPRRVVTGVMVLRVMQGWVRIRCSTMVHEWIRGDLRLRRHRRRRRRVTPP